MIKQSDIEGRLNLFRYGVVVVTVTAFIISFVAPMVITAELGDISLGFGELIVPALIITVIAGVIGIVSYFAYAMILRRNAGNSETSE